MRDRETFIMTTTGESEPIQPVELNERIKTLENSASFHATRQAVQDAQMDMLIRLRSIREVMVKDATGGGGGGGGGGGASSKELEALRVENERLRTLCNKQEYRIRHLIQSVEELQVKIESGADGDE